MEKYSYIQFEVKSSENQSSKQNNLFRKVFSTAISKLIPIANPLFENRFELVKIWLLEIENESGFINREVGLNENEDCIIILPFKNNYGYWLDTNMRLEDLKSQFFITEITEFLFEKKWADFIA